MALMRSTFRNWRRPWWFWRALADRRAAKSTELRIAGLTATPTAATTATLAVTVATNGAGTLFAVVIPTAAAAPSAAQVAAGQNGSGGAATWSGNKAVTGDGGQTFAVTGLSAATGYKAYAVFQRTSGSTYTSVLSSAFTTPA